jgi:flagellar protein FliS
MLATDLAPPPARPAAARAAYGRVALETRVAAASPHGLVALLYDRLARLLAEAHAGAEAGDSARRLAATERAIAIVEGLDATLDHSRGGSVAAALADVYALVRARLLAGAAPGLAEAEASIRAIGEAWAAIASAGGRA